VDALMQRSARPTNADLLAVLSTADGLLFDPGFQFEYSNTGYDVLGALIERVSGQSYPDFLEENIFGPLGMKNSFSLPSPRQKTDLLLAHSYVKYQGVIQPFDTYWLDDIVGSGTAYSTVEDMFLYDQALYTDAIVRQSTLAEAFQPAQLYDGTESPYGFGWEIRTEGGERSFAHGGKWLGYQSYYERFPDRKFEAKVRYIAPVVTNDTRSMMVEAVVENPDGELCPGIFATAELELKKQKPGVFAPLRAVLKTGEVDRVFVVRDGIARDQVVALGAEEKGKVEIRSGLTGKEILVANPATVHDGDKVR